MPPIFSILGALIDVVWLECISIKQPTLRNNGRRGPPVFQNVCWSTQVNGFRNKTFMIFDSEIGGWATKASCLATVRAKATYLQ